jgi:hypothetical protein
MKDSIKYKKIIKQNLHNVRNRAIRIKAELILLGLEIGVKEACARRGFSRTHWYKWWQRLRRGKFNLLVLSERSRRPHRSPKKISDRLERQIKFIKDVYTTVAASGLPHNRSSNSNITRHCT